MCKCRINETQNTLSSRNNLYPSHVKFRLKGSGHLKNQALSSSLSQLDSQGGCCINKSACTMHSAGTQVLKIIIMFVIPEKNEKLPTKFDVLVLICAIICPLLLHYHQVSIKQSLNQVITDLNQTCSANHNPNILVFARVPKTASQTTNALLRALNSTNRFRLLSSLEGMPDLGSATEYAYETDMQQRKRNILAFVENHQDDENSRIPIIYTRHQNFWDFSEFQLEQHQPLYFAFVRHPIERAISWYYYVRSPAYQMTGDGQQIEATVSIKALKESIEECVENGGRSECQFIPGMSIHRNAQNSHSSQLAFFCGHKPICDNFESGALFSQAVENFHRHFPVVGVTEYFNQSVQVLEAYLPRYFQGASDVIQKEAISTNQNTYKPPVSAKVRSILARNMSKEIEFYHLAKQRLIKQYKSLRMN